ncbi:4-alpha-glucanotransferase [Humidesulfovibrio mexicanus]|uniref:4-alpha-glucanotransferase n=1 Tax=Humidesulfovibrio mexicanus TaxID=147047 RepID=A0A239AN90_9BACT|nr:4-alpha-glucanotransferase [Humidesulfovibrio mexicanus]SNR96831.1 4-alpha-glucanotransferase [Humidesulfovibrio mexicanus]
MPPQTRTSGVLLHLTSLPSRFGIGDMGPEALRFAEFLALAGQSRWQVLPLNPTADSLGNSPYSSFSAFAGNTLCISPELLAEDGLLSQAELEEFVPPRTERVDFPTVERAKAALLRRIFDRLMSGGPGGLEDDPAFQAFVGDNASWLPDYALFMAVKQNLGGAGWTGWPKDIRDREERALGAYGTRLHREIVYQQFCQWLFFRQWGRLKWECGALGIDLVGDVPIYVTHDSADVWANRGLFTLDRDGAPLKVAGVPPDYFSKTGQRWGNPVFDWEACEAQSFSWWISRLRHNLGLFDVVRLDHFRGFEAYWEIDATEKTAINGRWVPGPGAAFFEALLAAHGALPLIAEDLGLITEEVVALKERFGLPGMKVLQFAFGPHTPTSPDSPHNHEKNCVVYTGTHDNATTRGWFEAETTPTVRRVLSRYLGHAPTAETIVREMVRLALASPANHAVIPAQDLLGLGREARMNTPGQAKGNWGWRAPAEALTLAGGRALAEELRGACELYGRTQIGAPPVPETDPKTDPEAD